MSHSTYVTRINPASTPAHIRVLFGDNGRKLEEKSKKSRRRVEENMPMVSILADTIIPKWRPDYIFHLPNSRFFKRIHFTILSIISFLEFKDTKLLTQARSKHQKPIMDLFAVYHCLPSLKGSLPYFTQSKIELIFSIIK